MTVKSFHPCVPATWSGNGSPAASSKANLSQQYAIVLETACTWLGSLETVCQTRKQLAHQTLGACEEAAKKLRTANDPAHLLDITADLMGFYLESRMTHWQQLATTGLQAQIEIMARFNHLLMGSTKERQEEDFSNFQTALPARAKPFEEKN